ncbi:MAG: 7TM diverse intracellular signaling domain-containing protein [Leptonema sp. (in: bacteria)]
MRWLFLVILLFFNFGLYSQNFETIIIQEKITEIPIGDQIYIYEDKEGRLDLKEVQAKISEFQKSNKSIPNFGYTSSSFWIYFSLKNSVNQTQKILLNLAYPLLDIVDYYLVYQGKLVKKIETGDLRNFFQREINHRNFLFPLELEPNQNYEIYLKIASFGSVQIPLFLISYENFIEKELEEQYIQGIYYGIMVVMILYNFFLLLSIRDKSYLYYVLYIFGIMMFSLIFSGYAFQFLWPNLPKFGNFILPFIIGFLAFFAGIFTIDFLRIRKLSSTLYKIFFGFNLVFLTMMILNIFLTYKTIIKIATYSILIFVLLSFVSSIFSYLKGWKPARYYIIAWSMVLGGMFILALKQLGFLPNNFITEYSLQIGSSLEVILLSLGLADRINILKKEKEKAEKEILETKVIMLESFSRFVPKHFVNILQKESVLEIKPGDSTEKNITVLFNDIKNFTTLAEMMSVKETFQFLNTYFETMNPVILKYHGFIDKFIGDEIMALFDKIPDFSLKASIEMRKNLKEFNKQIEKMNLPYVEMGIGINFGSLMLGTVGTEERLDTTVIGDTVNTAARIQQLTRIYKAPILLSEEAYKNLKSKEEFCLRKIPKVKVKGKLESIQIYECFDSDLDEVKELKLATMPKYEEAVNLIEEKKVLEAFQLYQEIYKKNPNDSVVEVYLERLKRYIPGEDIIL